MSIISKETAVANEIDEVVTELENKGVIKRAHSPYNSPVWPIEKNPDQAAVFGSRLLAIKH